MILSTRIKNFKPFTLVELLVVFAIIVVIASLLQPSLVRLTENARSVECLNIHRKIHSAHYFYMEENNSEIVALGIPKNPGPDALVKSNWVTWWPDSLREYLDGLNSVTCTSTTKYGIGMNHPELGLWLRSGPKIDSVRMPSKTVMFADQARIQNVNEPDPEKWIPTEPERNFVHFRVPSNGIWYYSMPDRAYARHMNRINSLFVDGHAENTMISDLGFQYPKNHEKAFWDR